MQQPPSSEPVYVISVAARLAGLPCWVLRVLDQEEIVVPARTDSNRRLYSDQDIAILARVRHLTEERHVNIAGVKVIFELELGQPDTSDARNDASAHGTETSADTGGLEKDTFESHGESKSAGTSLTLAGRNSLAPYNTSTK